jgi:hypothetical protein
MRQSTLKPLNPLNPFNPSIPSIPLNPISPLNPSILFPLDRSAENVNVYSALKWYAAPFFFALPVVSKLQAARMISPESSPYGG